MFMFFSMMLYAFLSPSYACFAPKSPKNPIMLLLHNKSPIMLLIRSLKNSPIVPK